MHSSQKQVMFAMKRSKLISCEFPCAVLQLNPLQEFFFYRAWSCKHRFRLDRTVGYCSTSDALVVHAQENMFSLYLYTICWQGEAVPETSLCDASGTGAGGETHSQPCLSPLAVAAYQTVPSVVGVLSPYAYRLQSYAELFTQRLFFLLAIFVRLKLLSARTWGVGIEMWTLRPEEMEMRK